MRPAFLALIILVLCVNAQVIPHDYQAFFAGRDAFGAKRYQEALAALNPVWSFRPESPLTGYAAITAARTHLALNQPNQALAILQRHASRLPQPAGLLLLANAAEFAGENAISAGAYQRIYFEYPLSEEAGESASALDRLKTIMGPDYPPPMPSAAFERADKLRRGGKAAQARKELLIAAEEFAGRDRDFARVRASEGDYRALAALNVSDPDADAERLYLMHAAARRSSLTNQAESALGHLNSHYPNSPWTMQALVSWGNHHLLRNNVADYEPLYGACAERFPSEPRAAYCHWKVAWAAWMRRDPQAKRMLEEHVKRFPESDKVPAALYFLGRYQALIEQFPLSFYSTLAREKAPAVAVSAVVESETFNPTAVTKLRIARAKQLEQAGFPDWAEFELKYAALDQPFVAAMEIADIVSRRGTHDQALRYVKSLARGYLSMPIEAAPQRFWQLAFPVPYTRTLVSNSRARELDPSLVAALIRQESEFNPRAVSRAKAYGLTQVLPSTGRQISRRLGVRNFRPSMLFKPEINLQLGTYYLKSLLDTNDGRWEAALAAYNAGQSRVKEWSCWYDYREPAEFIETIPFSETRNYVQIVLRNADVYRRVYGDSWDRVRPAP